MTILNGADNIQSLKTNIEVLKALAIANIELLVEEEDVSVLIDFKTDVDNYLLQMIRLKTDIEYVKRGWK